MDMFDDPPGPDDNSDGNAHDYTVSEISGAVKRVIEGEFGRVRVKGEVGRVFPARSGHLYFDIKDDRSVLASVAWKGQVAGLTARPEEGMEVVATGRLTTFGSQSKYQLTVEDVRPAGVGALMAMLEKRKAALEAEGLFAAERKRPLPYLPDVIGVVTSPSGAVIRDILHRLRDRFPRHVLVWPVAVQGRDCAAQVAAAIRGFNEIAPGGPVPRPDLLIVARGGGSIEDLWGFNEEIVARAAADSAIPLISAVGHETDTTLIDYVSDRRAPTPTAAAELAVPVRAELSAWLDGQAERLAATLVRAVALRRQRLADLARALPRPDTLTAAARQRLDWVDLRLPQALGSGLTARRAYLAELAAGLRPAALRDRVATAREAAARLGARLLPEARRGIEQRRGALAALSARLTPRPIARDAFRAHRDLDATAARLDRAFADRLSRARTRLDSVDRLHASLGYVETLNRGFALVRAGDAIVTDAASAGTFPRLEVQFRDGKVPVATAGAPRRRTPPRSEPPEQGSLL